MSRLALVTTLRGHSRIGRRGASRRDVPTQSVGTRETGSDFRLWGSPMDTAAHRRDLVATSAATEVEVRDVPPPQRQTLPKRDSRVTPYAEPRKSPDGSVKLDLHLPYCCFPSYRTDGKPSQVRVLKPDHPIAAGLPTSF